MFRLTDIAGRLESNQLKGELMRVGKGMLAVAAALVAFAIVGSSRASGQSCQAPPNYSPDFSSNQSCFTPNGTPQYSGYPGFYSPAFTLTQPAGTPNPAQPAPSGVSTVLRLTPDVGYMAGSSWYNTPLPVGASFSTTFTFQLSGAVPPPQSVGPADGIAFLIQNSGLTALGPHGCGIGFGDAPDGNCTVGAGIANSLAVEFDTAQNLDINDVSNSHVAIQSCGTGENSVDASCRLADIDLTALIGPAGAPTPINLADGFVHTATVTYFLQATTNQTACIANNVAGPCLDVILDGTDLFPAGVPVNLSTLLSLTGGDAYVGFTASTGGGNDNQDILSWVFTPQGQTQTIPPNTPVTYEYQNNAYNYAVVTSPGSATTTTTITPILMTSGACDALVQETYPGAHCFVYTGLSPNPDSAVMFEVTCPNLPNEVCNPFTAQLQTAFTLSPLSGVNMFNPIDPFPGWLKGFGGVNAHPCTPPVSGNLFQSDQISSFEIDTKTKGNSGGTGSCWVATYAQPDQVPPPITIASPTNSVYAQNALVTASYTCNANYQPTTSPIGPYLTVASCSQASGTQSSCTPTATGLACLGSVNTSAPGTFNFQVTAMDTGLNQNTQSVSYTVVAPTNLQIANLAPGGPVANGGSITYLIGVADIGPANADGVIVTDPLPVNTKFVSGSGTNIACSIVNRRLSCTTTPIPCSAVGNSVSCSVGMLAPLSISSLNGGLISIKVQVTAQPTTTCGTGRKVSPCTINTAMVSAINTDTNTNPTATAQTTW
jgi:uncharacterized repeat protein (TIGR01451 family)